MKNRELIKKALIIRKFEEKLLSLFSDGQLHGTVHTCIGQEWIGIAAASILKHTDTIFSNHRCHGHFLSWTNDISGLFAEILGRSNGVCGGLGGSQHLYAQGFYSNGIQGGMVPIAAGQAFAEKLSGSNNICLVFIGDGTWGQGVLYEALNIASKHQLPLLVVVENNMYAQSTHNAETLAGSIKQRAAAFDIEYDLADMWQLESLFDKFDNAAEYVRKRSEPFILEIETYRLKGHSKGDDYRDKAEILKYEELDLLNQMSKDKPHEMNMIIKEVEVVIENELQKAQNGGVLQIDDLIQKSDYKSISWEDRYFERDRVVNILNKTFRDSLTRNQNILMLGEDLKAPYGGAFKITKELSSLFANRVLNMPISESALIGVGTGMALGGYIPIVEIMFGDFLTLGFDQLFNHACKFNFMYNKNVTVPLVVRTPMGGRRGYGPTHSQSIEKHFLGIENLDVLALNCRVSPGLIYEELLFDIKSPTLVIENKVLYTRYLHTEPIAGFEVLFSNEKYPTLRISPKNKRADITLFCYGGILEEVERAIEYVFEEHEIICEVICPSLIYPLNIAPIIESINLTRKLLLVEEGSSFAALGSEVIAQITERGVRTDIVNRICWDSYVPASYDLEKLALPNEKIIADKLREMANG